MGLVATIIMWVALYALGGFIALSLFCYFKLEMDGEVIIDSKNTKEDRELVLLFLAIWPVLVALLPINILVIKTSQYFKSKNYTMSGWCERIERLRGDVKPVPVIARKKIARRKTVVKTLPTPKTLEAEPENRLQKVEQEEI